MSWNPFKSLITKRPVSHPYNLSKCLENIALLYVTNAFPFSNWCDESLNLTEQEKNIFYKICLTAQFTSFFNSLENQTDNEQLSIAATHSIFKIIAKSDQNLEKSLHYFFELNRGFISKLARMKISGSVDNNIHPLIWIASMWLEMEYAQQNNTFKIDENELTKLVTCMKFAIDKANSFFEDLCKNITVYDTQNVKDIYFSSNPSLNEKILLKKFDYSEVFQCENITLTNLVNSLQLDKLAFIELPRFTFEVQLPFTC